MTIVNGSVFCADGFFRNTNISLQNGIITEISDSITQSEHDCIDAADCYVIPGLVDIHIHGANSADFVMRVKRLSIQLQNSCSNMV